MQRILTDISGPFYDAAKPFRNWSALPFYQIDTPHPPYVDQAHLDHGVERAAAYLQHVRRQGYTGVVLDNLAHLVTFDGAPAPIYAPDDRCRLRALAYGAAFGRLFALAASLGMEVFVATDMQWTTPGVRRYAGRLHPRSRRLADVNRWALAELFRRFPQVSGVFVRTGETGGAHDQGREYSGHLLYRSVRDLRGLLETLLPACEAAGRLLVVRTWSIGIGELGDLMWSPERYRAVFGGLDSPSLLVSVKHGPSDFFRHMPANPTLGLPGPPQIVELQNRREYELFGMVPSSVAVLHRDALHTASGRPRADGLWAWNASGGWGGGAAALGADGWSLWTELSSALTAALARDPALDAEALVRAWCAERLGPGAISAAAAELYLESANLIERGWYLGPLDGRAALGRLALPSLLWTWWMRPTAAPLIWAYLAAGVPDVQRCLADSAAALARLDLHVARITQAAGGRGDDAAFVAASARYLHDCVAVAHAIRGLLLPAAAAARSGDRRRWDAAAARAAGVLAVLRSHRAAWEGRADFPALELDEVERYLVQLGRRPGALWVGARVAAALVAGLMRGGSAQGVARGIGVGAAALGLLAAWRLPPRRAAPAAAALLLAMGLRDPAVRRALPWLCRRYFLLPSIFFETGPAFTEWTN